MTQQRYGSPLFVTVLAALALTSSSHPAQAQTAPAAPAPAPAGDYAPVPPDVEATPIAVQGGGYCYGGPHPADASVAGASWDETQGRHIHPYPPLDLRLFAVQDGCYYFIGDPSDFGYRGQTYQYYGAHPVYAGYGGGWCFMIGGHHHAWRPWSPYFVVAGPWYYWQGPYDPFFWTYWPYYAVYYHHYYPHYYGGGRYYRGGYAVGGHGGGYRGRGPVVAPPIGRVAAPVGPVAPTRAAMAGGAGWGGARTAAPAMTSRSGWPTGVERGDVWRTQPSAASSFRSTSPAWGARPAAPVRSTPSAGSMFRGGGGGGWGGGGSPRFTAPSAGRAFRR
jgi:hypothetical protein